MQDFGHGVPPTYLLWAALAAAGDAVAAGATGSTPPRGCRAALNVADASNLTSLTARQHLAELNALCDPFQAVGSSSNRHHCSPSVAGFW